MKNERSYAENFGFEPLLDLTGKQRDAPAIDVADSELEYAANDKLEYDPEDWLPAPVMLGGSLDRASSLEKTMEMEAFLSDAGFPEASTGPSIEWKNGMPTAHPVTTKEFNTPRPQSGRFNFDDIIPMLTEIENEGLLQEDQHLLQQQQQRVGSDPEPSFATPYSATTALTTSSQRNSIFRAAANQRTGTFTGLGSHLQHWTPLQSTTAPSTGTCSSLSSLTSRSRNGLCTSSATSEGASSLTTSSSGILSTVIPDSSASRKKSAVKHGKVLFPKSCYKTQKDMILTMSAKSAATATAKHAPRPDQSIRSNIINNNTSGAASHAGKELTFPVIRYSFNEHRPRSKVNKPVTSIWIRRSTRRLFSDPEEVNKEN